MVLLRTSLAAVLKPAQTYRIDRRGSRHPQILEAVSGVLGEGCNILICNIQVVPGSLKEVQQAISLDPRTLKS